jgi:hypothetical protein
VASSLETRSLLVALLAAAGAVASGSCNPGAGAGELTGTMTIADCGLYDASYDLEPDFFIAEGVLSGLHLRIQRGSDLPLRSDGLWIDVASSAAIVDLGLGTPVPVAADSREDAVKVSMYFNDTCRVSRHVAPAVLEGVGGTVTFTKIYVPGGDSLLNIVGTLDAVELVDPASPTTRHAVISGSFDFIYNRGRPAQRYP